MLASTCVQAFMGLLMVGGMSSGGYVLYYLQRSSGEFLVSKMVDSTSQKSNPTQITQFKCKIVGDTKHSDESCKVFSMPKDPESNLSIKDFKSASFDITTSTFNSGNFFRLRLNVHKFPTIDISEKNIVELVKNTDNTLIAQFRIHARLNDGNLESYSNNFIAQMDSDDKSIWSDDVGQSNQFNYTQCKTSNFRKKNETESDYDNCNIDEISNTTSTSKLKTVDMTKVKPWYWTGKIEKDKLTQNQLFVIRVSGKYWKRLLDDKLKFDVKLWSVAEPLTNGNAKTTFNTTETKKFQLTFIQNVVVREDHTLTHIEGTNNSHIQEIFLI